ncbi:MAG: hypothetical protein WKG07_36190 [Hymenobacter sp.]
MRPEQLSRRALRGRARADRPGRDRRASRSPCPRTCRPRRATGRRRSSRSASWRVRASPSRRRQPAARRSSCSAAPRRPLLVAGGGVLYSGATEALRTFAEPTGIPVAETQAGKGALPFDHPRALGAIGATGTPGANELAAEADLVRRDRHPLVRLHHRVAHGLRAPRRPLRQRQRRRASDGHKLAGLPLRRRRPGDARRADGGARGPRRRPGLDGARRGRTTGPGTPRSSVCVTAGHGPLPSQAEVIGTVNAGRRGPQRGRQRGRQHAGRPAQALAHARAGRLPPGVRLLVHGLRGRRRASASSSPTRAARSSSWSATGPG